MYYGMSIRQGLLALLTSGPRHGYQLRGEFEERTGGTWPLNVGQVYTTLTRLERDGLVSRRGDADGLDDAGRTVYFITEDGRREVQQWFDTPIARVSPPRDELAIKLALAVTLPGVDVRLILQRQRTATTRALQDYTRLKMRADEPHDLPWLLVADSLIFQAEAEIRWLDHCEARLARYSADATAAAGTPPNPVPADQPEYARKAAP
jgi:DNA-binding PadR family transcriptional regulator